MFPLECDYKKHTCKAYVVEQMDDKTIKSATKMSWVFIEFNPSG